MCGRFSLFRPLAQERVLLPADVDAAVARPRKNIAPTQHAAVVTQQDPQHITYYRWGLIPNWAKEAKVASNMINARVETLTERPAYAPLLASQRCLVLADAFYEWQQGLPVQIGLPDGAIFPMAGLWDCWQHPQGGLWHTFTVVTVAAEGRMASLHDRMPAILSKETARKWLQAGASAAELLPLLRPFDSQSLHFEPLSAALTGD